MKETVTIIKKELLEIFRDRRGIVIILMPLFIFPILNIGFEYLSDESQTEINISVVSDSSEAKEIVKAFSVDNKTLNINFLSVEEPYLKLLDGEIDCYINIEDGLLNIVYNSSSMDSLLSAMKINESFQEYYNLTLSEFHNEILQLRLIDETGKTSGLSEIASSVIAPLVLILLIFQNTSSLANDIFAGEKERKTIEMLLLSGAKKQSIYCGKCIAITIMMLINASIGLASFISTFGSEIKKSNIAASIIVLLMIATVSVFIAVTVSMRSKSMKNSQMLNDIIMALPRGITLLLVLGFFKGERTIYRFIPFLNLLIEYRDVFIGEVNLVDIAIALFTNICLILLLIAGSVRYMKSEKIISQ